MLNSNLKQEANKMVDEAKAECLRATKTAEQERDEARAECDRLTRECDRLARERDRAVRYLNDSRLTVRPLCRLCAHLHFHIHRRSYEM